MATVAKLKPAPTLEGLTLAWLKAKENEAAANAERLKIEAQIVALLPHDSAEGSESKAVGDYKVAVRYGVSRKVDSDALQRLWPSLSAKAQEVFRWKADVATPKLRALQEYVPAEFAKLAAIIETKPSKPSVSIELADKEVA